MKSKWNQTNATPFLRKALSFAIDTNSISYKPHPHTATRKQKCIPIRNKRKRKGKVSM